MTKTAMSQDTPDAQSNQMLQTTLTTDSGAGNQARPGRARQERLSRRGSAVRNGLGRRGPIRLGLLAALALACGCAGPRGAVSIDPAAVGTGAAVPVLVASARAPVAGPAVFGPGRAPLSFARFVVSVPPEREPGSVTFPGRVVDPRTEFVTLEAARLRDGKAFVAAIDRELGGTGHDEAIVFVHGYNNTFAEGLYRQAQLAQDFGLPATSVNFAWPSAAAWDGYPYDKESAIFAAEGLSRTLDLVASSSAERVVVACHSMGCFLVLETMRIKALRGDDAFLERLHAVVMLAPDIMSTSSVNGCTRSAIAGFRSTSSPRAATRRSSCRPACTADKRGSA